MSAKWTEQELDELFEFSSGKSITPGGEGAYPAFGLERSYWMFGREPFRLGNNCRQSWGLLRVNRNQQVPILGFG